MTETSLNEVLMLAIVFAWSLGVLYIMGKFIRK